MQGMRTSIAGLRQGDDPMSPGAIRLLRGISLQPFNAKSKTGIATQWCRKRASHKVECFLNLYGCSLRHLFDEVSVVFSLDRSLLIKDHPRPMIDDSKLIIGISREAAYQSPR